MLVCVASTYAQSLDLSSILGPLVNQVLTSLLGSLGKRSIELQSLASHLQSQLPALTSNLQQIFANYESQIQNFLSNIHLGKRSAELAAIEAQTKGEIADAFNDLLQQGLGHLQSIAANLANAGLAALLSSLNGRKRFLESLGLGGAFNNIVSSLQGTVSNVTSSVSALSQNLIDAVSPHIQDLQDQLINHGLNAAQSLLGTLANISGSIGK